MDFLVVAYGTGKPVTLGRYADATQATEHAKTAVAAIQTGYVSVIGPSGNVWCRVYPQAVEEVSVSSDDDTPQECSVCGDELTGEHDGDEPMCASCYGDWLWEQDVQFAMRGDWDPIPGERRASVALAVKARMGEDYVVAARGHDGGLNVILDVRHVTLPDGGPAF